MTVAELIAELQKLPQDAYVRIEEFRGVGVPLVQIKQYGSGMVYISASHNKK